MIDHKMNIQRPKRALPHYPQQHTLISTLPPVSGSGRSLVNSFADFYPSIRHPNERIELEEGEEELQRTASESTALICTKQPVKHVSHTNESYLVNMTHLMAHCKSTDRQKQNDPQSRKSSAVPSTSSQSTSHTSPSIPASSSSRRRSKANSSSSSAINTPRKISTLSQTKALMKIRAQKRPRSSLDASIFSCGWQLNWSALELNLSNVNFIIVALCLLFTVHFLFPIVGAQRLHPGKSSFFAYFL